MYRIFVTDALRLISKHTATGANGGEYMGTRYWDLLHPHVETRTPDEIKDEIKARLRSMNNDEST